MEQNHVNPLLENFNTPHHTPPFEKIKDEDFIPAISQAIADAREEIEALITRNETPDFMNTIAALAQSGKKLDDITAIFFNLNSACTNKAMQEAARTISRELTEYSNAVHMNPELFARIKQVYDRKSELHLNPEEATLLEDTWRGFIKGGANLEGAKKKRFSEISTRLSELGLHFEENVLAETNAFELHIKDIQELRGLPEGVLEAAAMAAKEKKEEGWIFSLHTPSYVPFMKYADNRNLREKMYKAYSSRCNHGDSHDNNELIREITALRLEKAQLLGYPSYADYVLSDRMAQSPEEVNTFLQELLEASHPYALHDKKEVEAFAAGQGFTGKPERWDWAYYSNKLKQEKYDLDDEMLRPYFELEKTKEGIFGLATTLYGIRFKEVYNISKYHKDVHTYEVYDADNSFLALLYLDFFPRNNKNGGAWMTEYRTQHLEEGKDVRPLVSLVMNFTKPTPNKPSLLTFDEVTTFLHEFGHALHGMLSKTTYASTAGTNVYRDFVELPSQFMENWAYEKEWLDQWAVHYKTGEKIPQAYIERIKNAANFQSGYMSDRQLSFGITDMAWHSITEPFEGKISEFEQKAMAATEIFPPVEGSCFSVGFTHIFGGGYAAGYYSYKWAEVLDADAFALFREKGIFDKEAATSFRKNILEKGGTEHPMTLYVRFRGRKPSVEALLERSGLK